MEKAFNEICDEQIPLFKCYEYDEALNSLMNLEKQTRNGGDAISTGRVLIAIVELIFDAKNFNSLNEFVMNLMKKRSQLNDAVVAMIQKCIEFVDRLNDKNEKLKFCETLRLVSYGKIFLEIERARITRTLSTILESNGDLVGAAKIMEEIHIEVISSIGNREKIEFLLEQMRLCLANGDSVKTQLFAKKINKNLFKNSDCKSLTFKFYAIMIELDEKKSNLNTSRHYQAVVDTEIVMISANRRQRMMSCAILYCILAPFDNEQNNMMLSLLRNKITCEIPVVKEILQLFLSKDLISWSNFCDKYKNVLLYFTFFNVDEIHGKNCWKTLRSRVIEHNIRVISTFYTRIYISRLSELLSLSNLETEEFVISLIDSGTIQAKIDRLKEIIIFTKSFNDGNAQLNSWTSDIGTIMDLIKKTTHLIDCSDKI